jgi:hypothetical protein
MNETGMNILNCKEFRQNKLYESIFNFYWREIEMRRRSVVGSAPPG